MYRQVAEHVKYTLYKSFDREKKTVMLFVFIIGLLLRLSAVQGSISSYLPEIPPRSSNLASAEQNSANEVSLPFDGISPRFWFGQGYRQAFKQIIQYYNDQLLMDKGSDSGKVNSSTNLLY